MLLAKKDSKYHARVQKYNFGNFSIFPGKSAKRGFSKKALARIDFFFVLGSYESREGLEH